MFSKRAAITFEVEGDFDQFYLCHCEKCRKDTGSVHAANLFSKTAKLRWLSGEEHIRIFNYRMEGHIKSFCSVCGSALPNLQLNDTLLVVPAGSLDTSLKIKPQGHIFYDERGHWDNELEKVKKYKTLPE